MATTKRVLWIATTAAVVFACVWKLNHNRVRTVAAQAATGQPTFLNQGWTPEIRECYYQISQGSKSCRTTSF